MAKDKEKNVYWNVGCSRGAADLEKTKREKDREDLDNCVNLEEQDAALERLDEFNLHVLVAEQSKIREYMYNALVCLKRR